MFPGTAFALFGEAKEEYNPKGEDLNEAEQDIPEWAWTPEE